jgi:hypothetical protein
VKTKHKWKDNIKVNLKDIGNGYIDWIHLVQHRAHTRDFVNMVMNCRFL